MSAVICDASARDVVVPEMVVVVVVVAVVVVVVALVAAAAAESWCGVTLTGVRVATWRR